MKKNIREYTLEEITLFLYEQKEPAFRGKQIWQWIWQKGVNSFEEMKNLPVSLRNTLSEHFFFDQLLENSTQRSQDGTTKTAWQLHDGLIIESVLIPGKDRYTVCISSQVGCQLGCKFCATATLGFKRNLTPGEIFEQVVHARNEAANRNSSLSNIVLMGMGEPLLNYTNVMKAIRHITSEQGLGISPSRITLSTAGIAKGIRQLADDDIRFNLAVSLHSAKEEIRRQLMPVNQMTGLQELAESLIYFVRKTGIRPTLEYLLLKDVNNSIQDAKALADYCKQFPVKINIIEYNETDFSPFRASPANETEAFVKFLENRNMIVNIRKSKGKDIDAACGQLANKKNFRKKNL